MLDRLRPRLSYANAMATVAVFIALVGTGVADPVADGATTLAGRVTKALDIGKKAKKSAKRAGRKANRALRTARKALTSPEILRYGSTIPSGTTLTGGFGGTSRNDGDNSGYAFWDEVVSFPFPIPADLNDDQVNFAPHKIANDDDPKCTGTVKEPTAPPGKVCLYFGEAAIGTWNDYSRGKYLRGAPRRGFVVEAYGKPKAGIVGSWAYTAP
jgi:hypothetical protein